MGLASRTEENRRGGMAEGLGRFRESSSLGDVSAGSCAALLSYFRSGTDGKLPHIHSEVVAISWLALRAICGRMSSRMRSCFCFFPPPGRFHANQGVGVASIGRDYNQFRKQPGASQFSFPTLVGIQQLRFLFLKGFFPWPAIQGSYLQGFSRIMTSLIRQKPPQKSVL